MFIYVCTCVWGDTWLRFLLLTDSYRRNGQVCLHTANAKALRANRYISTIHVSKKSNKRKLKIKKIAKQQKQKGSWMDRTENTGRQRRKGSRHG